MDTLAIAYAHLFLGVLLMPVRGLDGAREPCPPSCRCTLEILNCSKIANLPGLHQVPLPMPAVRPHPFSYLDFTGNTISSIRKEVWQAYTWAEYVVLKDNRLRRLHNTSLEGLLSLSYLDLSYNEIQILDTNVFEPVPFLQVINLRGNNIERITDGTFRAWHGLQFLQKVDLSHNPLVTIQDPYFYSLPSLKLLDLGATKVTPRVFESLLQPSQKIRTLILPEKMSFCLCRLKDNTEVSNEKVKLQCTDSCAANETLCEKEEPWKRMKDEVMKVVETRKLNGTSLLNILPERAVAENDVSDNTEPNAATLAPAPNHPSSAANFNLIKSFKLVINIGGAEPIKEADQRKLKRLYWLAKLFLKELKAKTVGPDRDSSAATVQNQLPAKMVEKSTGVAARGSKDAFLSKKRHGRKVTRENWQRTIQRSTAALLRFRRDVGDFAKAARESAGQISFFEQHEAERRRKLLEGLSFLRPQQARFQSPWKHSISDSSADTLSDKP